MAWRAPPEAAEPIGKGNRDPGPEGGATAFHVVQVVLQSWHELSKLCKACRVKRLGSPLYTRREDESAPGNGHFPLNYVEFRGSR